ncbi:L-threonylcarbamoyladenylate synthase [Amaricoccus sp.]|uniref:L-threonylcarbamoyladenylate synthase n=1 Tax=Amaricoccus sp. TaxID=1872485 RepID=UPI001B7C2118|nr:L-threonylcarbamoyladenylate synthase [Amaricoccus sp.]MBP7241662.1 threonylcarbamoyl-AMP synthase [Amaricoccus sp.]
MPDRHTALLSADPGGVRAAAALLAAGELVAFPTETVYGLGADARSDRAAAAIFAAKGRPSFNPLIVHVEGIPAAGKLAVLSSEARVLAERFWPGPLTLVLPRRAGAGIAEAVSAGLDSVAVRAPSHPLARALIEAFGGPVAAPSANPSGRVSPTTAAHVMESLGGRIAAVLDGGPCTVGLESTIVGFADGAPSLLRPGGLPVEAIEAALGRPLAVAGAGIVAPGQLASHYAPRAALRLGAAGPEAGEAWLGFGPGPVGDPGVNLSETGDLEEAATRLFAALRTLDALAAAAGCSRIAVAPIPEAGLGRAINDRLRRAAAPRT